MITIRLVCYLLYISNLCASAYLQPLRRRGSLLEPPHMAKIGPPDIRGSRKNNEGMNLFGGPPPSPHGLEPPPPPPPPGGGKPGAGPKHEVGQIANSGSNKNNNNYNDNNSNNNDNSTINSSVNPVVGNTHSKKTHIYYSPQFPIDYLGYKNGSRSKRKTFNHGPQKKKNPHNHRHHHNDTILLSKYIVDNILEPYSNYCYAHLLSSGYLNLIFRNNLTSPLYIKNISLSTPTLLIRCNDTFFNSTTNVTYDALASNFSSPASDFLRNIALDLDYKISLTPNSTKKHRNRHHLKQTIPSQQKRVINNTDRFLFKTSFNHSLVMILFLQTTSCVSSYMILLVILLLPSDSRIRTIPVTLYVLLYVIIQTIYMHVTINNVFIPQYNLNIQDVVFYEMKILNSNGYKCCELLIHLAGHINWIYIVYYMFHKDDKYYRRNTIIMKTNSPSNFNATYNEKDGTTTNMSDDSLEEHDTFYSWLPSFLNNRNRFIISAGIILLLLGNIPFGILLWVKNLSGVRALYKTVECLIYSVFLCLTFIYIWCNFGNVLIRQRVKRKVKLTLRNKVKVLWRDYYKMIPILIYNIVSFILTYFCTIYFTTKNVHLSRWRFNFVYLLNLLITVNVWGLIGSFEKREIALNKNTILGRKIDNADPFFFDFSNEMSVISSTLPRRSRDSFASDATSLIDKNRPNQALPNNNKIQKPIRLKYPFSTWKSKINRLKDNRVRSKKTLRKHETEKRHSIRDAIKCFNHKLTVSTDGLKQPSNELLPIAKGNSGGKTDTVRDGITSFSTSYEDGEDTQSIETELTRNVIYYYDQNVSSNSMFSRTRSNSHVHMD
ncbi:similar to Saccharomyces cerevisiae YOR030W DFG16 Probable multiple transmembrane protein, involved in diploid invasive and pseudohyphal growth upon nitrogen starvation [Maudiozyma saulgeensis]|uniref:Similar to Saccharomyces cerevisiae YOR030W DFG16 Probable multiple transmembrane protein, involved in diploid invasive and pseudohyphal growth upon nitrogen starvation n=1 Tax=Maudiozyma saulgeensis TaxID=1789683 RepID=A0A1X7QXD1_9SACH|nr:similar to Saccharomyces cerevisiae YOR030W DFG16 Probable multiple transmembrane protein, involved in diploid invasive and pseudohyphal growth upon nitrogen starvation [Kazachstania saulgeensis]